jgi:hypothetical protein
MPEPQDQFVASIASEAVEVLEDHLLFPGGYLLPLSARGTGVPGMTDRPWSRLSADVFYPSLPVMYSYPCVVNRRMFCVDHYARAALCSKVS